MKVNLSKIDLGAGDMVRVGKAFTMDGMRRDEYTDSLFYVVSIETLGDVGLSRERPTTGLWAPDEAEVWINAGRLTRVGS